MQRRELFIRVGRGMRDFADAVRPDPLPAVGTYAISRKTFVVGAAATAGMVLAGCASSSTETPVQARKEFSGDIEQTKAQLLDWAGKYNGNDQKIAEIDSNVRELAVSYFVKQTGYQREGLEKHFKFVSSSDFEKTVAEAGGDGRSSRHVVIMGEDSMYIRKDPLIIKGSTIQSSFYNYINNFFHAYPPFKSYEQLINVTAVPQPVDAQKGLVSHTTKKDPLLGLYEFDNNLQTVMAGVAAKELYGRMGLIIDITISKEDIERFDEKIVKAYFNGDPKTLVDKMEQTDVEAFYEALGERIDPKNPKPSALNKLLEVLGTLD